MVIRLMVIFIFITIKSIYTSLHCVIQTCGFIIRLSFLSSLLTWYLESKKRKPYNKARACLVIPLLWVKFFPINCISIWVCKPFSLAMMPLTHLLSISTAACYPCQYFMAASLTYQPIGHLSPIHAAQPRRHCPES